MKRIDYTDENEVAGITIAQQEAGFTLAAAHIGDDGRFLLFRGPEEQAAWEAQEAAFAPERARNDLRATDADVARGMEDLINILLAREIIKREDIPAAL